MTSLPRTTSAIASVGYRLLLFLYPAEHRAEYGSMMQQVFRDMCRAAYGRSGLQGLVSVCLHTLIDTLINAIRERNSALANVRPTWEMIIILGGCAMLSLAAGYAVELMPIQFRWRYQSLAGIQNWALPLTLFCLVLSVTLIRKRYAVNAAQWGRKALAISALAGGVVLGLMMFNLLIPGVTDYFWSILAFSMMIHFLGVSVFGVGNLRWRSLPRGNALPVLIGSPISVVSLLRLFIMDAPVSYRIVEIGNLMSFIALIVTGVALTALGLLLTRKSQMEGKFTGF